MHVEPGYVTSAKVVAANAGAIGVFAWAKIVKLDAMYYTGVTGMVGFWLIIGEVATPFSAWAAFAGSYLAIVAFEPVVTYVTLKALKSAGDQSLVTKLTSIRSVSLS